MTDQHWQHISEGIEAALRRARRVRILIDAGQYALATELLKENEKCSTISPERSKA